MISLIKDIVLALLIVPVLASGFVFSIVMLISGIFEGISLNYHKDIDND